MPHIQEELKFSAPSEVHHFAGALGKQLGVDPNVILATSHGRRSIDVLKLYDPSLATWEHVCHVEGLIPKQFGEDAVEIPGARTFLDRLEEVGARWAIVTSGTRPLVTGWLDLMKLAHPKHLVCAEMVDNGKPDPACYLLGNSMLDIPPGEPVVVFEDAPAGVRAGKAGGFKVVALATTHTVDQLKEAGADWIVRDMRSVTLKAYDQASGRISIEISDALQE
ncbi:DL-glycerol-3-phosphatase [Neofusicoccum ribis]|uniref:DL-glycerol-3-phosphatase n=1 Tax=Neofusicoccum ribis TaxID=45134 RepID=A0ABR3T5R1_9PEZI